MAEDHQGHIKIEGDAPPAPVESTDRGLFDFMSGKKDEEKKDEGSAIATEFDQKVNVSDQPVPVEHHKEEEAPEEKKHSSLRDKLHRSGSSSSSSSVSFFSLDF